MNRIYFTLIGFILSLSLLTAQENRGFKPVNVPVEGKLINLYEQSHALVIGNINYTGGWSRLPGVEKDIMAVKQVLEQNGFNVVLERDLNKEAIDKAINSFIAKYSSQVNNRLLIYYAGHGNTIKTSWGSEQGYIVPIDAPKSAGNTSAFIEKSIEMAQFEIYAKRVQAKHCLFIFDACFSGTMFRSEVVPQAISYKTQKHVRQFITSGSADQEVPDESIFRKYFVNALTTPEADYDKDGYLTGTELGLYLQNNVSNMSRNTQNPQYGKIKEFDLSQGDFVFELKTATPTPEVVVPSGTPPAAKGSIELTTMLTGKLYVDGAFSKEVAAGSTYTINNLQTGVRVLSISGTTAWTEKVMVLAGQTTKITAEKVITTGTLSLASQVSGKLYIDDIYRQTIKAGDNISLNDLNEGTHVAQINDPLTAKEIWKESFNINVGKTVNLIAQGIVSEVVPAITGGSGNTFTDPRDGKTYKTVKIGTQTWMAENLSYVENNGSQRQIIDSIEWANNNKFDGWCYYNNSISFGKIYGALYQWGAAKKACPYGWHLPSDDEWKTLEMFVGVSKSDADSIRDRGIEGKMLKSTTGWNESGNGTNNYDFSALPGGVRNKKGVFDDLRMNGSWWTSSDSIGNGATWRRVYWGGNGIVREMTAKKAVGLSVRCLKENNAQGTVNEVTPINTGGSGNAYTETASGLNLDMVFVKGGSFAMGSPLSETDRKSNETQHTVTVSNFFIGKTEVTFSQYDAFCDETKRSKPADEGWGRGNRPVINVSWNDATAFCEWLSRKSGKTYRLSTEAEWEYAARAGTTTPFNTGSCLNTSQANYDGNYPLGSCTKGEYRLKTLPVGSFNANAWGLYDMHGNVWEWCSDWSGLYSTGDQTNPQGPSSGTNRIFRGGGWRDGAKFCRTASRLSAGSALTGSGLGFRVVRVP